MIIPSFMPGNLIQVCALIGVAVGTASALNVPDENKVRQAFANDDWTVMDNYTMESGYSGYYAEHNTATILDNGKPKKSYFVSGNAWDMGYQHGVLSARIGDAQAVCETYLHHMAINLLNEKWDEEMAAKCDGWVPGDLSSPDDMSCETYEALLNFLEVWLIAGSSHSFHQEKHKFPEALVVEMRAFVAGALSADPDCSCTFDKMLFLNYGIDFLMSALYAGQLPRIISEVAEKEYPVIAKRIRELPPDTFKIPYFCNSFTAKGDATLSGQDIFMSRDFQMPTGLVYQDVAADVVFFPVDGRLPHVSSGTPGMIGRVTVMNSEGVSMGVDIVRAAASDPSSPGMNSILMLRHVADNAGTTKEGLELVASTERGCPWLYPLCDGRGDCVIIEAGKYLSPGTPFDPLQYVNSTRLKQALPSQQFFDEHSSNDIFDRGLYARPMDWNFPDEYLSFNEGLYAVAGEPYDSSEEVWGPTGFLFSDFEAENDITRATLHNNFYPPMRESWSDVQIVSNNAIVPEFRTSMMSIAANFWETTAHAAQWRYDSVNAQIAEVYGKIDMKEALRITSFLSPNITPGYWTNTINDDPMSAMVEGTLNVIHITELRLTTKTGYWSDAWTQISLNGFL